MSDKKFIIRFEEILTFFWRVWKMAQKGDEYEIPDFEYDVAEGNEDEKNLEAKGTNKYL